MEPSEREIIIRTDNDSDVWEVYIVKGARGQTPILKKLQNKTEDAHAYRGTLPKRGGIRFGKIQRRVTDKHRRHLSESMKQINGEDTSSVQAKIPSDPTPGNTPGIFFPTKRH